MTVRTDRVDQRSPVHRAARDCRWLQAGTSCCPHWFSRLHPRYKTPLNSIIFVGAVTLLIAISSQIGAGIQEAFQLVDNAANVFYGTVYSFLFAIPLVGAVAVRSGASIWLRIAALCGVGCFPARAIFFTVYPIIDVPSPVDFCGIKLSPCQIDRECNRGGDLRHR